MNMQVMENASKGFGNCKYLKMQVKFEYLQRFESASDDRDTEE